MAKPFSKETMLGELRDVLWATADCLGSIYSRDASWRLLGLDPKKHGDSYVFSLNPSEIDMAQFPITDVMSKLYDYTINARWDINFDWIDMATDHVEFLEGLQSFHLLNETSIRYSLDKCLHIVHSADARWCLDDERAGASELLPGENGGTLMGGFLTLRQMALLAQMDEKSVRNATNPKLKNHLKTFSRVGRTFVYRGDAREWLAQRRSFKPTEYYDSCSDRDLNKVGFHSDKDFGQFLTARRDKLKKSVSDVVREINAPGFDDSALVEIENSSFVFDKKILSSIARVLDLDPKAYVMASLALKQKLERKQLEEEINHGPEWGTW